jgi:two-component system, LytTR family, response regulator LytT
MYNVLVLEDNDIEYRLVEKVIKAYDENINILRAADIKNAMNLKDEWLIDLFILDVILPDGSGIAFAKALRQTKPYKNTWLLFITGFCENIGQALGTRFIDFIIKPFESSRLVETLDLIHSKQVNKQSQIMKIKKGNINYQIAIDDVIYIESKNKDLYIVTKKERLKFSRMSLSRVIEKLPPDQFVKTFRSIAVNKDYIYMIVNENNTSDILLTNGNKIPLSRKYREEVKGLVKQ